MQISGERFALANRMLIPVRRHGHEDLSGSDVDAGCVGLKYRAILLPRPIRLFVPLPPGWHRALAAAHLLLLGFLPGHSNSLLRQPAKPRKEGTLLIGISSGWCSRTVTTVLCTGLGTTLLIGFEST